MSRQPESARAASTTTARTGRKHLGHLIAALAKLRTSALALEAEQAGNIAQAHPARRDSARNLTHYLALRQSDIRRLQVDLSRLGLSRLARSEAHTLASLEAVLAALHALAGDKPPRRGRVPVTIRLGEKRLEAHALELLGAQPAERAARIMVTMPSEAASDPALVRNLLLAGMNVMRINCAHDSLEAWLAMIANLREAERVTGLSCRICADLAGPKLRTGVLRPLGRKLDFKPTRDAWGKLAKPARVWITPREQPEAPPENIDAVLPVEAEVLREARSGDSLALDDSRGGQRDISLVEASGRSWLAHAHRHVFLRDGAGCALYRDVIQLAKGTLGPLPEVVAPLLLKCGDHLRVTTEEQPGEPALYDNDGEVLRPASIPCTLEAVFERARAGQPIWFDDGKIGGRIISNRQRVLDVEITHAPPQGGKLRPEKGINLPQTDLDIPSLSAKDLGDLEALATHVDMIGLSFVRQPSDVLELHAHLRRLGAEHLGYVLKIETRKGFENLPRILMTSMRQPPAGVMVARGDLGVEIGFERLAEVQEQILWLCEAAHVPVIWATQVLEGMARRGLPSRAEVSDAAFGVRAECVMLNKGPYIVETTRFLADVLTRMTGHNRKRRPMLRRLAVSGGLD